MTDLLVRGIGRLLTMAGDATGLVEDAAVSIVGGRVEWAGPERELPPGGDLPELDAGGACVVPGFVDAHTHLVWAGTRREEFLTRMRGERYDGRGILDTVRTTTSTPDAELVAAAEVRARAALSNGTTTLEVKTGYALAPEGELALLRVIGGLATRVPQRIERTYLAHVPAPGVDRAEHVAAVAAVLPGAAAAGATWFDVFADEGAFTVDEARLLLRAAAAAGLGLRMHADQLSRSAGAQLAAECGCASADHLDRVDAAGARAMADAGVVGVLLPTATLATRGHSWDTARVLREAGVSLALGTDCNPGTSWCESMPFAIQLACFELGLSVEQALRAATAGSATSLRRTDVGQLVPGAHGDLVVLEAAHEADLVAHLGAPAVRNVVIGGEQVG